MPAASTPLHHESVTQQEFVQTLRHTIARLARRLRHQDDSGLGATLTAALATIKRSGSITHGELAAAEHVSAPTMSAVVAKMEAAGFVTRTPDDHDRRVVRLRVTPEGEEYLDITRLRRTEWLAARLADLDADQRDVLARAVPVLAALTAEPPGEITATTPPAHDATDTVATAAS